MGFVIAGGIAAVGAVAGGVIAAGAARDAANTQADATRDANAAQLQMFNQTRADLAPYREAGQAALGPLSTLAQTPLTYDPYAPTPAYQPSPAYSGPTLEELRADPGYAFRVSEGQKRLERSAAGRGLLLSGGQLKDLTRFGQDMGSQEYAAVYGRGLQRSADTYQRGYQQNADIYNRALQGYQTNYNTLLGLRNLNYSELAGVAGAGQGATNTLSQLGTQVGTQLAQNTIGAGNAQAAGTIGAANAYAGIGTNLAQAGNQYNQYRLLSSLADRSYGASSPEEAQYALDAMRYRQAGNIYATTP